MARYKAAMPAGAALNTAGQLQYLWMGMNTEHPKLQDIKVRQAIQHAVDVDVIIAAAYSNIPAKSFGVVCPGLIGHRTATKSYSYDPEKAGALLAEAGLSGLSLSIRALNTQKPMLAAQIIQANLGLWAMRFAGTPDPYEARHGFVSSQVGIWNRERWKKAEYGSLYDQGIAESDTAKRTKSYLPLQDIMAETGAYLWI